MDVTQRHAAAAAVREAMHAKNWEAPQLAARAQISVETVRDFLAARRWPRSGKRSAMEAALGWEQGRIAAIAEDALPVGDPVQLALDRTELSADDRYEVLTVYLRLLHRSRRERDARGG